MKPADDELVDDDMLPPVEIDSYDDQGFFIINRGFEGVGSGSIDYYHRPENVLVNDIYEKANDGSFAGLGLQCMEIIDGKGYIVATGSDKIIVVNPVDMNKLGEINGFTQPRYITAVGDDRAYVSQWGQEGRYGSIQIVDLVSNIILDSIATRKGPEEMIRIGNDIFVTNTGGVFVDSVITKINTLTDEVQKTIEVGLRPTYLEVDKDLNLWVLTRGLVVDPANPEVNIRGRLARIENDEVMLSLPVKPSASNLTINKLKDKIYFSQTGWVYEHPITATSISLVPFIEQDFFTLEVDPQTDNFIGLDGKDLEGKGTLFILDQEKELIFTDTIGISSIDILF